MTSRDAGWGHVTVCVTNWKTRDRNCPQNPRIPGLCVYIFVCLCDCVCLSLFMFGVSIGHVSDDVIRETIGNISAVSVKSLQTDFVPKSTPH